MDSPTPICGYCGLSQTLHDPNDHIFDAVGGSLGRSFTLAELSMGTVNLAPKYRSDWRYMGVFMFCFVFWGIVIALVTLLKRLML